MVSNCRGNPAWLLILRAATQGRLYNIRFGSGLARVRGCFGISLGLDAGAGLKPPVPASSAFSSHYHIFFDQLNMISFIPLGVDGFPLDSPKGIGIYYIKFLKVPTFSHKEEV